MKKTFYLIIFLFTSLITNSQNSISYGPLLGWNGYDIEIDGPLASGSGYSGLNVGGFIEYKVHNRLGLRGNLIYSKIQEDDYQIIISGQGLGNLVTSPELKTLNIQGLLKFDVRRDYKKGFYFIGGAHMTNILEAKSDSNDVSELYKSSSFGIMFGFGFSFAKYFAFELIPETNITNTIDLENNSSRNAGIYTNLTINLSSMLAKKQL